MKTMSVHRARVLALLGVAALSCGGTSGRGTPSTGHSSSMALSADGKDLFVANPEADSVSVVDTEQRTLKREIPLGSAPPSPDANGAFAPAVMPRAVALSPDGRTLFVTGERSSALYFVDVVAGSIRRTVHVGSEPIGVLVSSDGESVYVACSEDATVVRVDAKTGEIVATVPVPGEPWALSWSPSGSALLVSHLLGPGVTAIDPARMSVASTWRIPDVEPRGDKRLAHGAVRGLYDVAVRPSTDELWTAHALLATDTAQPELDFESTAFPALSIVHDGGGYEQTLSTDAADVTGIDGAFGDVVSGPHAIAFTQDGDYALMTAESSGDVLVVDAGRRLESSLVRPLPGAMPDGIVLSPDERFAYVDERVSHDVAVLKLSRSSGALSATVDGPPIPRLTADPMPAALRFGEELFNSADSTRFPITTDHWVACATCHMEGRSDAVTWRFEQGPRDTPSNAGGMLETGFLFRTADRNRVEDYWHTINVEQGGRFDPTEESSLLDSITRYVNFAIPLPVPPTTDAKLAARGADVFRTSGCPTCHAGPAFTDSGSGNPTLDLAGPITLHDVGTCVTSGPFLDAPHEDVEGHPREACAFDTPSLRGLAATPPYLHDGSAATIRDAVLRMPGAPSARDDLDALVEYLRSL